MSSKVNTFSLLIAGDIMPAPHNMHLFENGNINELFGEDIVQLFRSADYSIANLEGCLTTTNEVQPKSGPVIKATPSSITAISNLGLTAVALANNHITDANQRGLHDTIEVLASSNVDYVGVGTVSQMKSHLVVPISNGKTICVYNVSEIFFNEPEGDNWGANIYDEYLVCKEVEALKKRHDYVVVIFHAGSEYFRYPTPDVKRKCHRLVDSGADVITTQHTHCIGCEEFYNGSYILYGQGNFCFGLHKSKERQKFTQQGILLQITFEENGIRVSKILTTLIDNSYVRKDAGQNFSEFDKRSAEVKSGKDYSNELTDCKTQEIAEKYIGYYRNDGFVNKILRKFFPKFYKNRIMNYTSHQLLAIYSTLAHSRRNEEMKLIFRSMINQKYNG